MNATTRAEHPTFVSSAEHRSLSGWTIFAIGALVLALLSMAVQPAYQSSLSVTEETPSLLE